MVGQVGRAGSKLECWRVRPVEGPQSSVVGRNMRYSDALVEQSTSSNGSCEGTSCRKARMGSSLKEEAVDKTDETVTRGVGILANLKSR